MRPPSRPLWLFFLAPALLLAACQEANPASWLDASVQADSAADGRTDSHGKPDMVSADAWAADLVVDQGAGDHGKPQDAGTETGAVGDGAQDGKPTDGPLHDGPGAPDLATADSAGPVEGGPVKLDQGTVPDSGSQLEQGSTWDKRGTADQGSPPDQGKQLDQGATADKGQQDSAHLDLERETVGGARFLAVLVGCLSPGERPGSPHRRPPGAIEISKRGESGREYASYLIVVRIAANDLIRPAGRSGLLLSATTPHRVQGNLDGNGRHSDDQQR